jgi:hypothetical protein
LLCQNFPPWQQGFRLKPQNTLVLKHFHHSTGLGIAKAINKIVGTEKTTTTIKRKD